MSENNQTSTAVNIEAINNAASQTLIHLDLVRVFYTISPSELEILEEGGSSIWKDLTFAGIGLGIPCCINAIIEYNKVNDFNSEIFWNSLIGSISMILAIVFSFLWYKNKNKCKKIIDGLKERPPYSI